MSSQKHQGSFSAILHMKMCPYIYFQWYGYTCGARVSFVRTDQFSVRVKKNTSRISVSSAHICFSICFIILQAKVYYLPLDCFCLIWIWLRIVSYEINTTCDNFVMIFQVNMNQASSYFEIFIFSHMHYVYRNNILLNKFKKTF